MSILQFTEIVLNDENEPIVMADGKYLCHVVDANGETDTIGIEPDIVNSIVNLQSPCPENSSETEVELPEPDEDKKDEREEWSDEQTRYILDKYYEYLAEVGPLKKFRLKKNMWAQIAKEINEKYNSCKTATKIENRYKTVMKRKKKVVGNNSTSGAKRVKVDFEDELKKITSIDDSIEPEILQDQSNIVKKESSIKSPIEKSSQKKDTMVSFLKKSSDEKKKQREAHHREKEENRERRHREKLQLLKELFKNE